MKISTRILSAVLVVCMVVCGTLSTTASATKATYNTVFASPLGRGYSVEQAICAESSTYAQGTWVYIWGFVHDLSGNHYYSYESGECTLTLYIYNPDGSLRYSSSYDYCADNWIGCKLCEAGKYKIVSRAVTDSYVYTSTNSITVY